MIEITVPSTASNYTFCVFVETTPPPDRGRPHKHLREEEIFTVLEGDYEFFESGTWTPMEAAISRLSLRNTFRAFRNVGSSPRRMMLTTNGGGSTTTSAQYRN